MILFDTNGIYSIISLAFLVIVFLILTHLAFKTLLTKISLRVSKTVPITHAIYIATTFHSRFFPVKHSFMYPVLYIGCDLDKLESKLLDISPIWFKYNALALLSISPKNHLGNSILQATMKEKLFSHLKRHSVSTEDIKSIYFVTMPRLLGYAFNPVSFYYLYDANKRLRIVVLEVNNTFGEKHVYVLECNDKSRLREDTTQGYDYGFDIVRQFHVSPFNDRKGTYTCFVKDPIDGDYLTTFALKLVHHTSDKMSRKKMMARLDGLPLPFTPWTALLILSVYPMELLITLPRILYEAWKLHYPKKLDVYPKPPPQVGDLGTVGQKPLSKTEKYAKNLLHCYLDVRAKELGVIVRISHLKDDEPVTFGDDTSKDADILDISTSSPLIYTDLLWTFTADDALWLGMVSEKRWNVSSIELFRSIFSYLESKDPILSQAHTIRKSFMDWAASFAQDEISFFQSCKNRDHHIALNGLNIPYPVCHPSSEHFLDLFVLKLDPKDFKKHCKELKSGCDAEQLEYRVFKRLNARFVQGTSPFESWQRVWKNVNTIMNMK